MTALAIANKRRQVVLRQDSSIAVTWGWYVIEMRMVDLLVLSGALDDFLGDRSILYPYSVIIQLNDLVFNLTPNEITLFADLIHAAAAELPRQVVRWADLKVTIRHHAPIDHNGMSHFSNN